VLTVGGGQRASRFRPVDEVTQGLPTQDPGVAARVFPGANGPPRV
jgi:hypothetical protein